MKDIDKVSPILVDYLYDLFKTFQIISSLDEIVKYITENTEKSEAEDSDGEFPESRIKRRLNELIALLLENFDEKMEFQFFFKTCSFNFKFTIGDFKRVLYAIGKAKKLSLKK